MAKGRFETGLLDRRPGYVLNRVPRRGPGVRDVPEPIRLDPEPDVAPRDAPPVRIFLGSEPEQHRAERIFVWSVHRHRDPARRYEIHLMKEVRGFDRSDWKTGFSRYRFAVPAWAGGRGRAIYNDVDQIYLADPAELFDLDMGDAAMMSIDRRETSVMLLDCERLAPLWRLDEAHSERKKHFRALAEDCWAPLPGVWNARDGEYTPGESKLLHYSTLHTQPWRPFPDQLFYRDNAQGDVWFELEASADAARFEVFTREKPSARFLARVEAPPAGPAPALSRTGAAALAELVADTGAKTLTSVGFGTPAADPGPLLAAAGGAPEARGSAWTEFLAAPGHAEGVLAVGCLERLPEEDVPWALDAMFARAERFVLVEVSCQASGETAPDGDDLHACVRTPAWWQEQIDRVARRAPDRRYALVCRSRGRLRSQERLHRDRDRDADRGRPD